MQGEMGLLELSRLYCVDYNLVGFVITYLVLLGEPIKVERDARLDILLRQIT